MASKQFVINSQRIKDVMRLREKYAKRGKLVNLLAKKEELNKDLDKVLVNQVKNFSLTEDDVYKARLNINRQRSQNESHRVAKIRSHHLTNYLYDYLINAFQTGLVGSELSSKHSFQISRINLPHDMRSMAIFWLSNKNEDENVRIEGHLSRLATDIRYLLSSNRVLGYIPPIEFKRDDSRSIIEKLDELLLNLKDELNQSPNNDDTNTITVEPAPPEPDEKIPIVHNVYGVNYEKFMNELKTSPGASASADTSPLVTTDQTPSSATLMDTVKLEQEKHEQSIKALKINQKLRREKQSRSALLKLALIEYEQNKEDHN